jgi:alkylation response protein AidB-like acyl-CoA dehydrogenase
MSATKQSDGAIGVARAELVKRAKRLQPLLSRNAEESERLRRLSEPVEDGLTEAGLFRILTPKRLGGLGLDVRAVVEVTQVLGEADTSAAWVVAVSSVANWIVCTCSAQLQDEIFGADPDARVAGGISTVPAVRVDGGWVFAGRWPYASGSSRATWAMLGAPVLGVDGSPVDAVVGVVPMSELSCEETWFTAGMRGTGSNTLLGADLYVPDYRVMSMQALGEGEFPIGDLEDGLPRLPFGALTAIPLLGPLLGAANAALQFTVRQARKKPVTHTSYQHQSDSVAVQVRVAEAAMRIESARLHTMAAVDEIDTAAWVGGRLDYPVRARIKARGGFAAQELLEGINLLLNVHGAGSFAEGNPMQRYWRDANVGARHAALNAMVGYESLGKSLLGQPERITGMI